MEKLTLLGPLMFSRDSRMMCQIRRRHNIYSRACFCRWRPYYSYDPVNTIQRHHSHTILIVSYYLFMGSYPVASWALGPRPWGMLEEEPQPYVNTWWGPPASRESPRTPPQSNRIRCWWEHFLFQAKLELEIWEAKNLIQNTHCYQCGLYN